MYLQRRRAAAPSPPNPPNRRAPRRFAPFYSGSGYGAEALSYVSALLMKNHSLNAADVWVTHSGDAVVPGVVRSMEPGGRALLERQVGRGTGQGC